MTLRTAVLTALVIIAPLVAMVKSDGISTHPVTATAPLNANTNVTFTCVGIGFITWEIANQVVSEPLLIQGSSTQNFFRLQRVYAETNDQNSSQLLVTANLANNGTQIRCILRETFGSPSNEPSDTVYLYVYGSPNPPSNLTISQTGLSWDPPFSLEGENISYIVEATNTQTGLTINTTTSQSQLQFEDFLHEHGCSEYQFRVFSLNPFGQSLESINGSYRMPIRPFKLLGIDISTQVSHMNGLSVMLQFANPSPCDTFRVTSYNLTFVDQGHSDTPGSFSTIVTNPSDSDQVAVVIDYQNTPLEMGRHYMVYIEAVNQAGSSMSEPVEIYTTGLQYSSVVLEAVSFRASVTCTFAVGSDALGCEVSFYKSSSMELMMAQNITREPTSNTVTEQVSLASELLGTLVAEVSELQADGSVHPLVILSQELENTFLATTSFGQETTTTQAYLPTTVGSTPADVLPPGSGGFASSSIIIGAALGAFVVLLILSVVVGMILVVNCAKRTRKPNFIPGDPSVAENEAYGALNKRCHHRSQQKGNKSSINTTRGVRATTPQDILQPSDLFVAEYSTIVKKPAPYEVCVPSNRQTCLAGMVANPMYSKPPTAVPMNPPTYEEIMPKTVSTTTAQAGAPAIYDQVKHDPDGVKLKGNLCYGVANGKTRR